MILKAILCVKQFRTYIMKREEAVLLQNVINNIKLILFSLTLPTRVKIRGEICIKCTSSEITA